MSQIFGFWKESDKESLIIKLIESQSSYNHSSLSLIRMKMPNLATIFKSYKKRPDCYNKNGEDLKQLCKTTEAKIEKGKIAMKNLFASVIK